MAESVESYLAHVLELLGLVEIRSDVEFCNSVQRQLGAKHLDLGVSRDGDEFTSRGDSCLVVEVEYPNRRQVVGDLRRGCNEAEVECFEVAVVSRFAPLSQPIIAAVQARLDLFVQEPEVGSNGLQLFQNYLRHYQGSLVILEVGEHVLEEVEPVPESGLEVYVAAVNAF